MMALIAVCAIAPVPVCGCPRCSAFHMSTYAVALLGKIMCRDCRAGDGPDLGLHRCCWATA
jgi:hypothetical protein